MGEAARASGPSTPGIDRFWPKVDLSGPEGCWPWIAGFDSSGYGMFNAVKGKPQRAHRYSYELHNGPVPAGLVIDHLCRNRACVNPIHLEAVTNGENIRRGESPAVQASRANLCLNGHDLAGAYVRPDGSGRICRECKRVRARAAGRRRGKFAIREWARANGYAIGRDGGIKAEILRAYEEAHRG